MAQVRKTVGIDVRHEKFLQEEDENLSEMAREAIDKRINQYGWVPK